MINLVKLGEKNFSRTRTWKCALELERILPPVRVFSAKGSIDRYGFTHILASRCGMKKPKRTFAEWVHGWIWDEHPTAESLAVAKLNRSVPVVVRNKLECDALKKDGFREIFVGGLPFSYLGQQNECRNKDALLAFPPHSAEAERLTNSQLSYMDYLASLQGDFDGIYVSIFHLDWGGPLYKAAKTRNLNVVLGARPDDANSLVRTRSLFDAFKYVTSNTMGSHFIYALSSGCVFCFSGPLFKYDGETLLGNGNPHNHSWSKIERFLEIQSESYLRSRFGRFFASHPFGGTSDVGFGNLETGAENILDEAQIREAVGWTLSGQMLGYSRGGVNRIGRSIGLRNGLS